MPRTTKQRRSEGISVLYLDEEAAYLVAEQKRLSNALGVDVSLRQVAVRIVREAMARAAKKEQAA